MTMNWLHDEDREDVFGVHIPESFEDLTSGDHDGIHNEEGLEAAILDGEDIWLFVDPYKADVDEEVYLRWATSREDAEDDRGQRQDAI